MIYSVIFNIQDNEHSRSTSVLKKIFWDTLGVRTSFEILQFCFCEGYLDYQARMPVNLYSLWIFFHSTRPLESTPSVHVFMFILECAVCLTSLMNVRPKIPGFCCESNCESSSHILNQGNPGICPSTIFNTSGMSQLKN